jgi:hypothetical protein
MEKVRAETENDLTPLVLCDLRVQAGELESVHHEVLLEVREISFRDYVRDRLSENKVKPGNRRSDLMSDLGSDTVSIKAIRDGQHLLSALYHKLSTKTLSRDLDELTKMHLVVIKDGRLRANFEIMDQFTVFRKGA